MPVATSESNTSREASARISKSAFEHALGQGLKGLRDEPGLQKVMGGYKAMIEDTALTMARQRGLLA